MTLEEKDKQIINHIQSDFPICKRPYAAIGDALSMDEAEVITRVAKLKEMGIIRRIGGNFSPEKVGFHSTLCGARVPEEKLETFAEVVNSYKGVTHNYVRDDEFNVWFTFIEDSVAQIEANLAEIAERTGVTSIYNLPATHIFKIRAEFTVE
ncbi:AsnC family transcriptional regulator [Desulfoluna butyratoxydans]|uniref:siroheme decarboxylase n=1 Tax=Desulfoluna butyratoxydans TaxID=231438 RepID=A0A4U8YM98_9BACT|nr:AsnC family transcriptional regulator [Desulfoluna butyratoxydans]VFQ42692.1 asnc-type hth domain [Desulfoluna butyratoxydans]